MRIKEAGENTIVCQFTEDELESMGYGIEDIEEDDDLKEEFLEECLQIASSYGCVPTKEQVYVVVEESAYGVNVVFNNMAKAKKSNQTVPMAVENIEIDKDDPSEDIEKIADNIVHQEQTRGLLDERGKKLKEAITNALTSAYNMMRDFMSEGACLRIKCRNMEEMIDLAKTLANTNIKESKAVRLPSGLFLLIKYPAGDKEDDKIFVHLEELGFEIDGYYFEQDFIKEHGTEILKKDAIKKLASFA